MTIEDLDEPQSPGWWLRYLSRKLQARNTETKDLFDRYEGETAMPRSLLAAPESAKRFYQTARTSFAEMIVKSVKYPLKVSTVLTAVENGDLGDAFAWRSFSSSGMEEEIDDVHRLAILSGNGYGVLQHHGPSDTIRYTAEDPREVITQHDPVIQSEIIAAAKFYHDDIEGRARAILWLPGKTYYAFKEQKTNTGYTRFGASWSWDDDLGGSAGKDRTLPPAAGLTNDIPVFRYRNEEGVGEFRRHVGLLDRVDHMVLQGMTIATYQAFKQRAIKVDDDDMPDIDPETGREIDYDEIFAADPGSLWRLPQAAEIWESGAVDLTPVWTGVDKTIQQLAAVTFTPLAMFAPEGQNQSAAGSSFAREGRTFKIEDRQARFGHIHAKALAMLFALQQDYSRSNPEDLEIVWRPAERLSLTEMTDALSKSASMPWQARMEEIMQYSPRKVARMKKMRDEDSLREEMYAGTGDAAGPGPAVESGPDFGEIKNQFDALGVAIRAGVEPEVAAQQLQLQGLKFTGAVPVSLRQPETEASRLEEK